MVALIVSVPPFQSSTSAQEPQRLISLLRQRVRTIDDAEMSDDTWSSMKGAERKNTANGGRISYVALLVRLATMVPCVLLP